MSLPRTNTDTRTTHVVIADDAPMRTRVRYSRAASHVAAQRSGDHGVDDAEAVAATVDLILAAVDRPDLLRREQAGDPLPSLQK